MGKPPKYIEQDKTDCNEIKEHCVVSSYLWTNAPEGASIAIMEVIPYSNDWVLQRFTNITSNPKTKIRCFYNDEAWSEWIDA